MLKTALLFLEAKNISEAKLTLMSKTKFNQKFYKNKFLDNTYYAFLPISYYLAPKEYKVIISYIKDEKKSI